MEESIAEMDRMMGNLGGRYKADILNATPPPEMRRRFAPGFMPGPPPGRERDQGFPNRPPPPSDTDPYRTAPGRAQAQAKAQGYGYAPGPVPGAYRGGNRETPHDASERTGRTGRRAPSPPRRRRTSQDPTARTTERGDGRRAERTRGDEEPLIFERFPAEDLLDDRGNFMGGDPNRRGRRMSRPHR
jgi:hypothetical protein